VWTFLPVLYSAHFTFYSHFASHGVSRKLFSWTGSHGSSLQQALVPEGVDPRMFLVFVLQVLWSFRLSTNTFRRGFYSLTEEDYVGPTAVCSSVLTLVLQTHSAGPFFASKCPNGNTSSCPSSSSLSSRTSCSALPLYLNTCFSSQGLWSILLERLQPSARPIGS
jgi:hypothetical protein